MNNAVVMALHGINTSPVFWKKIKAGRLWHALDSKQKLVGFVRYNFNTWDAYVTTNKKWPEAERCVNLPRMGYTKSFWNARHDVEHALESPSQ